MPTPERSTAFSYRAEVVKVVDGDTVDLKLFRKIRYEFDAGFNIKSSLEYEASTIQRLRLAGINTPELRGEEREAGLAAKEALIKLLESGPLTAHSYKASAFEMPADKYGRWLAVIEVTLESGVVNVNEWLIANGFAVVYLP